jgi:hypothetical protein
MEKLMEAVVADESGARRTFEAVQEDTGEVVWRAQRSGLRGAAPVARAGPEVPFHLLDGRVVLSLDGVP